MDTCVNAVVATTVFNFIHPSIHLAMDSFMHKAIDAFSNAANAIVVLGAGMNLEGRVWK